MKCQICFKECKKNSNSQKHCTNCAKKIKIEYKREWRKKRQKPRYCIDCNIDISNRGGTSFRCKKCQTRAIKLRNIGYVKKRKRHIKERMYNLRWSIIQQAFFFYSNGSMKCNKCGYNNINALSIDHLNNGGCLHRRKITASKSTARYLVSQNFPEGYQILCRNCNWLKNLEYLDKD